MAESGTPLATVYWCVTRLQRDQPRKETGNDGMENDGTKENGALSPRTADCHTDCRMRQNPQRPGKQQTWCVEVDRVEKTVYERKQDRLFECSGVVR